MAYLNYNEITPKKVILWNDEPHVVLSYHVFRKQQRKPVNITKLKNLKSGRVVEVTFHQNETAEEADLETREIVFIFKKPGEFWFHNAGSPGDRFMLPGELIGEAGRFIKERSTLSALVFEDPGSNAEHTTGHGEIIGVRIPIKVDLTVKEATPAVKGNTSSGATKEVTLETGTTIQVPQFINEGDVISVNTETGLYSERIQKA